jgi:hypothetical protein
VNFATIREIKMIENFTEKPGTTLRLQLHRKENGRQRAAFQLSNLQLF